MAPFPALRSSPVVAAAAPSLGRVSGHASAAPSKRRVSCRAVSSRSLSIIRCEQSAKKGGGPDTWLGRAAMVGFASAIAVEVATGKGFLQSLGVGTPAPTLALAVSGLVVGLAVFFLLQSGSGGGTRD
uniref:Stress enhanced protein 1, chloroplastic n=1 Tax=Zea mays TaxID=4577 RepID=B6SQP2_MAIZE|nr:hypothetical protein [Zea mays]